MLPAKKSSEHSCRCRGARCPNRPPKPSGNFYTIPWKTAAAKSKACVLLGGGQTGTAQSGWINDDGTEVTQSWYCGYFPYEDPQYVVTVLKENGEGGSVDCAPVFAYIADEILKLS